MATPNQFFRGRSESSWKHVDKYRRSYDDLYSADFSRGSGHHLPNFEFRVPMCCNKCEEKVHEELSELQGVSNIFCDQLRERVVVIGYVDPFKALKKLKHIKKKSEFWDGVTNIRSSHERRFYRKYTPRIDSVYRSSPNQVIYYREPSRTFSYDYPYRNADDSYDTESSYHRPSSPAFNLLRMNQSYRYEWVPPFAQSYYTEEYPSYTSY